MPMLTLKSIRENPWNAVTHTLPPRPERLLLEAACRAAAYCHQREFSLMFAARAGRYLPAGWEAFDACPDVHEESEARALGALDRWEEISAVYQKVFGVVLRPAD